MLNKIILFTLIVSFVISCQEPSVEIDVKKLPNNGGNKEKSKINQVFQYKRLYAKLNELLLFELKSDEIWYVKNHEYIDDVYAFNFLKEYAQYHYEVTKDSTLIGVDYLKNSIESWENKPKNKKSISVYYDKVWESKNGKVQFTYVYIPSVKSNYKILLFRESNNDKWEMRAFGM